MMLERKLYKIITDGIADFIADATLVSNFFQMTMEDDITEAEADAIAALFVAKPPSVTHGYARTNNTFPLYAIVLSSDAPDSSFIGNDGGMYDADEDGDDEDQDGASLFASVRATTVTIIVYTQHPDHTLYNYWLLEQMIVSRLSELHDDYFDLSWSGADMMPDAATMPAGLFARRLTLTGKRQYQQLLTASRIDRVRTVRAFVDSEGAPGEDVGGVPTLVRPYVEEDDDDADA